MSVTKKPPVRIVVLGAGFGGVYAFKRLHALFHHDPDVQLVLVNSRNYFLFTPLLHEVATGGVARENIVEPLRNVLGCCLAEFHLAEVTRIDLRNRRIITDAGTCAYDYAIIAFGAETDFYGIPGAQEHAYALKSLEDAVRLKNRFIQKFEEATRISDPARLNAMLHFVVVGGGPTGVELAAEMSELFYETFGRYYPRFRSSVTITLIQAESELVPHFPKRMREKSLEVLRKKRIDVRLGEKVRRVDASSVTLGSGEVLATETTVWVAGVKPYAIPFDMPVEKNAKGRIMVNEYLQMRGHPEVFVLGDMAAFTGNGTQELPMLAQVATKEAGIAADNIRRAMRGMPLMPFVYRHAGEMISLGQWMALAKIKSFFFEGQFAWWLWRTVYLSKLLATSKKLRVALDWTIQIVMPRDISEL